MKLIYLADIEKKKKKLKNNNVHLRENERRLFKDGRMVHIRKVRKLEVLEKHQLYKCIKKKKALCRKDICSPM